MLRRRIVTLALLLTALLRVTAAHTTIKFQSTAQQTLLLELYTSEGCSSCPPAEKWLSRLTDSPRLWRDFVPVAFHVDYWDHLGWRDPWGAEQFSERQRNHGSAWHSRTIYTPEFVLNGKEWRNWSGKQVPNKSRLGVGIISLSSTDTNSWSVGFKPAAGGQKSYQAHVVWLISNVKSNVKAGENEGRTLKHDFVALTVADTVMNLQGGEFEANLNLPPPAKTASGRLAIAAWITEPGQLEPIQATGGWVTRP